MEIHFEAGLKRPRDATESAKLVSEAVVAVRCHARPPNTDSIQE